MAFVVVTHQHPGHTSLLPELLRKCTAMPVAEAGDNLRVKPNCIYVARPEGYLAMLNGRLQLMECRSRSAVRLPIDYFFRSLAEDQREHAVGIILSGTASDGTLGVKAIKGAAGHDHGAGAGVGQICRHAAQRHCHRAGRLRAAGRRNCRSACWLTPKAPTWRRRGRSTARMPRCPEPMLKIILLLRNRTGHDFSSYKPTTIRRRIERRMNLHQVKGPQQYLRVLQENPHELDLLFKELLIGVTSFFRDPDGLRGAGQDGVAKACWRRGRTTRWCGSGCPAAPPAKKPIRWPSCCAKARTGSKKRAQLPDFRHRPGQPGHRRRARRASTRRASPSMCRRERLARFFVKEDDTYRLQEGNPGTGRLRAAERHQGPALHQARPDLLPQPADLSERRRASSGCCRSSITPSSPTGCCSWDRPRASAICTTTSPSWTRRRNLPAHGPHAGAARPAGVSHRRGEAAPAPGGRRRNGRPPRPSAASRR